ncbi:MAG: hypothetical protein WC141_03655, partial [Arcobacteraceae bacterium]
MAESTTPKQNSEFVTDTKNILDYQNKKVLVKQAPTKGQNVAVYVRPGDEIEYKIDGIDLENLDYRLVGGDIVVTMPNGGIFTFVSMALMGYSDNQPSFSGANGQKYNLGQVLSQIEEVNSLPFDSIPVEADIQQEDRVKKIVEDYEETIEKLTKTVTQQQEEFTQYSMNSENSPTLSEQTYTAFEQTPINDNFSQTQTEFNVQENTFTDFYDKPIYNNPKVVKPDGEMIPKPDGEMIPKPDEEMIPDNGFTNDDDFTDYYPDDGNGDGNGDGDGPGEGIPSFGFKATAHQVRFSETTNNDNTPIILGGGGSIQGYESDSITDQFEPETIDMSDRAEDMVIRAENSTYFSNTPSTITGVKNLTFKDLIKGQSVTVDGLKLTAKDSDISAEAVAAGFAELTASAANGNAVTNGTWSGTLSNGWESGVASTHSVSFSSTAENSDISVFNTSSAGSTIVSAPADVTTAPTQGGAGTTESHTLTFKALTTGQSVTVDGLTLTATEDMTNEEVATVFASITNASTVDNINTAATKGDVTGTVPTLWTSGTVDTDKVIFTSTTDKTNVTDISVSSAGLTVAAPADIVIGTSENTSDSYLSRVLRFEPNMPEGFYVDSFTVEGLPSGVKILDKNGLEISTSNISRDDMVFKDTDGNVIDYNSADFLTNFKNVEFTMKYDPSIKNPFNLSITANYKIDAAFAHSVTEPEQSQTNEYTFALKDITEAGDYTYKKGDFAGGLDNGFILSKEANYNIIKDGSGNSTIVGGIGTDIIYDGTGNDTIYLSGGSDTVYGGAGENIIYGDTYLEEKKDTDGNIVTKEYGSTDDRNTVRYDQVKSFSLAEVKYLKDKGFITAEESQILNGSLDEDGINIDMLKYYNGVYVDLKGFSLGSYEDENGIMVPNETINALSKFALTDDFKFFYDIEGNVTGHEGAITTTSLKDIQLSGQDTYHNIDDIIGSAYNDTIKGNNHKNIIDGGAGNDTIYGVAGDNILKGGAGYDMIYSGSGNDYIDGETDTDTVNYQNSEHGVIVRLDKPKGDQDKDYVLSHENINIKYKDPFHENINGQNIYNVGTLEGSIGALKYKDTLVSIEDVIGSKFDDIIFGSGGTNYIEGMGGDDKIFSGGGINFIDGGAGSDWISYYKADYININTLLPDGGVNDNYMRDIQGITVTMATDFTMVKETTSGRLIDLIKDIEQVRGTAANDVIIGKNGVDQTFWGLGGDDRLWGGNGADKLYGGDGDDYIRPRGGLDISYGGAGTDYIELIDDGLTANQTLRLSEAGTIQFLTGSTTNGIDGTWTDGYNAGGGLNLAYEFEGFGASNGNDIMYGNSQNNVLNGHNGNDIIYGIGGNNIIRGGNDHDTIYGGTGNDTIYGDAGNDIIDGGGGANIIHGYSVYNWNLTNKDVINGGTGANNTLDYRTAGHGGFTLDMNVLDGEGATYNGVSTVGYATVYFTAAAASTSNKAGANAYDDKIINIHNIVGSGNNDTIYANDSGMTLDGWGG